MELIEITKNRNKPLYLTQLRAALDRLISEDGPHWVFSQILEELKSAEYREYQKAMEAR